MWEGPENFVKGTSQASTNFGDSTPLLWARKQAMEPIRSDRSKPKFVQRVDDFFAMSKLQSSLKHEILGGISTFLVSMYILSFEPELLSSVGMNYHSAYFATCIGTLF
jgi:hypothetical protein